MRSRLHLLTLAAGAALASVMLMLLVAACGPKPDPVPVKPMPAGASFQGYWYSDFDHMRIHVNGNTATGTFEYKTGGNLNGAVQGGVLVFDWIQPGDISSARRDVNGRGYFVISDDGQKLEGRWGYGESLSDGGKWNAEKVSEDPRYGLE